jgi:putative transposase
VSLTELAPGLGTNSSSDMRTLWQCNFFSKKVVSKTGLRDLFVLVFLHVETRRVFITPSTYKQDEACMIEQAEAFERHTKSEGLRCKILMHDNDCKYSVPFLDAIKQSKIKAHRTAIRSPNTVAYVERVIQTLKQEVLDEFIVSGRTHMDHLCEQFRR